VDAAGAAVSVGFASVFVSFLTASVDGAVVDGVAGAAPIESVEGVVEPMPEPVEGAAGVAGVSGVVTLGVAGVMDGSVIEPDVFSGDFAGGSPPQAVAAAASAMAVKRTKDFMVSS